jgi:hypothetical protein
MSGKRLLLLKEILESAGSKDVGLFTDLVSGFRLTGTTPMSNELTKRLVLATLLDDDLKETAGIQRKVDACKVLNFAEQEAVVTQTKEEIDAGWLEGPFSDQH